MHIHAYVRVDGGCEAVSCVQFHLQLCNVHTDPTLNLLSDIVISRTVHCVQYAGFDGVIGSTGGRGQQHPPCTTQGSQREI